MICTKEDKILKIYANDDYLKECDNYLRMLNITTIYANES